MKIKILSHSRNWVMCWTWRPIKWTPLLHRMDSWRGRLLQAEVTLPVSSWHLKQLYHSLLDSKVIIYKSVKNNHFIVQCIIFHVNSSALVLEDINDVMLIVVSGCPDLRISGDFWVKRNEEKTTIGCYNSKQTWQLHCHGNQWIGVIGNCTLGIQIS